MTAPTAMRMWNLLELLVGPLDLPISEAVTDQNMLQLAQALASGPGKSFTPEGRRAADEVIRHFGGVIAKAQRILPRQHPDYDNFETIVVTGDPTRVGKQGGLKAWAQQFVKKYQRNPQRATVKAFGGVLRQGLSAVAKNLIDKNVRRTGVGLSGAERGRGGATARTDVKDAVNAAARQAGLSAKEKKFLALLVKDKLEGGGRQKMGALAKVAGMSPAGASRVLTKLRGTKALQALVAHIETVGYPVMETAAELLALDETPSWFTEEAARDVLVRWILSD